MKFSKNDQAVSTTRISHRLQQPKKDRENFRKHLVDLILWVFCTLLASLDQLHIVHQYRLIMHIYLQYYHCILHISVFFIFSPFRAYDKISTYNLQVWQYSDWLNVFFRQNEDRQAQPGKTEALPHDASPTAAEKDLLVNFCNVSIKLLNSD